MEIFEVLDRFELLNEGNEKFELLRRSYIDEDIYSILQLAEAEELSKAIVSKSPYSVFRLVDNKRCVGDIEDLRKAVLEDNLHSLFRLLPGNEDLRKAVLEDNIFSIFRLIGDEDLKKLITDDNIWSLFKILSRYTDSYFVKALKDLITNDVDFDKDCFSRGQLQSKLWLIQELKKTSMSLGTVFLCAGWYGTLATMMFENNLDVIKIRSFDNDPNVWKIAEIFNKKWVVDDWKFKASVQDIHDLNFNDEHVYRVYKSNGEEELLWDSPDTIINTSSEHIHNFTEWYNRIPDGKLVVIQGNDYFEIDEHVNCSKDLKEFSDKSPMTTVLYEGELELPKYKRFMKIGFK